MRPQTILLGAIAGDMIGSPYERRPHKSVEFPLFSPNSTFTDDSVLTVAVADALLSEEDYASALRRWSRQYPHAGYGGAYRDWFWQENAPPYHSFGNGSAMRASAVGWACQSICEVLEQAALSAAVTHNHPEGIKGAQAAALAVYLARRGASKRAIYHATRKLFSYELDTPIDSLRRSYRFDVTCQGSVPQSILCFLCSHDFESALRLAVSLGGDADTMAAIAGAIAEAYYGGVPAAIQAEVQRRLPADLWRVVQRFNQHYSATID
jgi:ADP-ribosylglycohydrolase